MRMSGLLRLGNCMMAFFGVLIGAIVEFDVNLLFEPISFSEGHYSLMGMLLADGNYQFIFLILLASISAFTITGAGNALNDYHDRMLDRKAHPDRPIPSGRIPAKEALYYSKMLFILGVWASVFINWLCFLLALFNSLCLISYERKLKARGFVGNVTISYLTASVFLYGGAAVLSIRLVVVLFLLAFLANIGREVTKDIEDIEADRRFRRTLPMTKGKGAAAYTAVSFTIVAVVLSSLPMLIGYFQYEWFAVPFCWCTYGPIVTVADVIFIYSCILVFRNPKVAQTGMKVAMSVALLAFLSGGLIQQL